MKDFLAKIKTMNYKQFALEHGEKIGLGVIGVVALACLGMTTWTSDFNVTPDDMVRTAEKVDTQLKGNVWPDTEKATFLPLKTAEEEGAVALNEVDLMKYDWQVEMSPKLYPRQKPAGEITWLAPVELYARYGTIPMGVPAPPSASDADETTEKKKPAKKSTKKQGNNADELMSDGASPLGMGIGMNNAGFGMGGSEKSRGVRFNVVVGIINALEQQKRLAKAMNLDSNFQAAQYLEYLDFKVQRQRAVPGPETWSGPWKDLSIDSSSMVLAESSDADLEIVPTKYTAQVLTSPLPHRVDVDWWDANLVGHPKVPTLTEDEQEMQDAANRAAAELAGDDAESQKTARKGFARSQKDANRLRDQAMEMEGGKLFNDKMKSLMPPGMSMPGAARRGGSGKGASGGHAASSGGRGGSSGGHAASASSGRGGSSGGHAASAGRGGSSGGHATSSMGSGSMMPPGMSMGGPGMGMRSGMGSMGSMGAGGMGDMYGPGAGEASANVILFRYFDFDVEPGECYRYRVQIEVLNPNFGETFVDQPSVAEGETRTTPWSEPSTAAAVEKDVNYALTRVTTKSSRPDGAELNVVQWDPSSGTLLSDQFKVPYGSFVSKAMKSLKLDIPGSRFEVEDVNFNSKDVLLDSSGAPNLSDSVKNDLKLSVKQFNDLKRAGDLDLAVTVNRFGEIMELDAGSKRDLESALQKVKDERAPYADLKDAEKKAKKDQEKEQDEANKQGKKGRGRKRNRKDGANPLRSSMGSMEMMMPGMGPPAGGGRGGSRSSR